MDDKRVSIGRVAGVYGVKGWLKVFLLTDFPERFRVLKEIYCNCGGVIQGFIVESSRPHKKGYLLKLEGVDSPEKARSLHNALLQIDESDIHPLPAGAYYHFQLKGLKVFDGELGYLGTLSEIMETGANDVYVVESPRFGEILIPALQKVIKGVDIGSGRMEVTLLPGLVDSDNGSSLDYSRD